jgi:hypothetical protein
MTTIATCDVPVQDGIAQACKAVFTCGGHLLIMDGMPLESSIPDKFKVDFEGSVFEVAQEGSEHMVIEDDREAFTAMAFG